MSNTKSVGAFSLGLTYAGCFLGAGYVSGQELWQFFGSFGLWGYFGLAFSVILFFIFGVILVRLVQITKKSSFDEVIIYRNYPRIRNALSISTILLMFSVIVIMCAGAGSILDQTFEIPYFIGCAVFCLMIGLFAMGGISWVIKVFSYVVPVLVFVTLVICFSAVSKYGINTNIEATNVNPLIGNWFLSALNYVSYNIIGFIGTIVPVALCVKSKNNAYTGIMFGCIIVLSLATGIILAITSMISSVQTELPMLDVAFSLSSVFGYVYSALLLCAMLGTSLACFAAITEYIKEKFPMSRNHMGKINSIIGIISFFGSLAGFGTLVGLIYPIFGYLGFVVLFFIVYSYILVKNNSDVTK